MEKIGDKGAMEFANALITNTTLTDLYLGGRTISYYEIDSMKETQSVNRGEYVLQTLLLRILLLRDSTSQQITSETKQLKPLVTLWKLILNFKP